MYGGKVLETGTVLETFRDATQPYTQGLLRSIPRLDRPRGEPLTPDPRQPAGHAAPARRAAPSCRAARCALERCVREMPPLEPVRGQPTALRGLLGDQSAALLSAEGRCSR